MKINEIISEAKSPYEHLKPKPLEVTVTDQKPEQGTPPPKPTGTKGSYNNPDDLAAAQKDIEDKDPGINPVTVIPVVKGIQKAQTGISALKKIIDTLRKPKQPKKKQDKNKAVDRDKLGPNIGGGASSSRYQYDPDAGVKGSEWFKRNRGRLIR